MITVRCPACDAAYQLDDAKLAAGGRKLKCARCQTVWLAEAPPAVAEAVADALPQPVIETPTTPPTTPPETPAGPEPLTETAGDAAASLETAVAEEESFLREYAVDEVMHVGGWRQWVRGGNAWRSGALGLILLGLITGVGVVTLKLLPASERQVAAEVPDVVLPQGRRTVQPPEGVVLHNVRDDISKVEGELGGVALTVRGLLANTTSRTLVAPPMRLELLGDDGKVADSLEVSGVGSDLAAGSEQAWTVSVTAPDMTRIRGWRVVFVEKVMEAPAAAVSAE